MPMDYDKLAAQLDRVADLETEAYRKLRDALSQT